MVLRIHLLLLLALEAAAAVSITDLREQQSDKGSTWTGKVTLPENFAYTVAACEGLAGEYYAAIRQDVGFTTPISDTQSPILSRLFGEKTSTRPRVNGISVYTFRDSQFAWVGSLPKGAGLAEVKRAITTRHGPLFEAVKRGGIVDHRVHSEELAWSQFESDPLGGINLSSSARYPGGSITGTYQGGDNDVEGRRKNACSPSDSTKGFAESCTTVAERLGVTIINKNGLIQAPSPEIQPSTPEAQPPATDNFSDMSSIGSEQLAAIEEECKQDGGGLNRRASRACSIIGRKSSATSRKPSPATPIPGLAQQPSSLKPALPSGKSSLATPATSLSGIKPLSSKAILASSAKQPPAASTAAAVKPSAFVNKIPVSSKPNAASTRVSSKSPAASQSSARPKQLPPTSAPSKPRSSKATAAKVVPTTLKTSTKAAQPAKQKPTPNSANAQPPRSKPTKNKGGKK